MTAGSLVNRVVLYALVALFLVGGPALLAWGATDVDHHQELVEEGTRTEGTVVSFADSNRASQRDVVVEFVAEDARIYTASALADHSQHPDVGSTVTVAYDRGDPEDNALVGYETSGSSLLGIGVILTLIGYGVLTLVGVSVLARRRRMRRARRRQPTVTQSGPTGDE